MMTPLEDVIQFGDLKQSILNIILNSNPSVELNNSTHDSGIYLLYVDNFDDEKIIPFYIGKTVNFQSRFRSHINNIKKLMKFSYAEYHNIFFWSAVSYKRAFEGKYRSCKIFKYIVDHNCTIDDIKMIILENCDEKRLNEREQYYLSKYLPSFFGFNQIATITEQFLYRNDTAKMRSVIEQDLHNFQKYMGYGYSTFNYLHAFSSYGNKNLDQIVNNLLSNQFWLPKDVLLSDAISAFENYKNVYYETYEKISDRFSEELHNIFSKCKIKSKSREEEVLQMFTNHYYTTVINDVNDTFEYLKYYFSRDKKSRECGELIKELYNVNAKEINQIVVPIKNAFESYVNSRINAIEQSEYSLIFPRKSFG